MRLKQRCGFGPRIWLVVLLVVSAGAVIGWGFRDHVRSPAALYREARNAKPERAAVLHERLSAKLPMIDEYARLWAAEVSMPDPKPLRALQDVVTFRPQSPVAYQAHVAMARYYASIEASSAVEEYRAAIALQDTVALRLELARELEERGDSAAAYTEYRQMLNEKPDAFGGMRRTGLDPLSVAQDLNDATYYTDALETLREVDEIRALPLRAHALAGLGRYEQAETIYREWLDLTPHDAAAQLGLARVLVGLGRPKEAMELYETVDTPDSWLAQAELLEDEDPDRAIALYLDAPYPVAWWNATWILEAQGRLEEAMSLYTRISETDTYFADDAAFRLYVLGQRLGDEEARAEGEKLLNELGPNWLAVRASGDPLHLSTAPPLEADGGDILNKVTALDSLGRSDLADMELLFAARFRTDPEVVLATTQELAVRGHVIAAQEVAEAYIEEHERAPLAFWKLAYPRPYEDIVEAAAAEFGVDPLLIWAVMRVESRYDPEAISIAGARGLMQIIPSTQDWIAEQLGEVIRPGDAYKPETNIRMGAWFLHFLSNYFERDLELALAAYNGGASNVESWQSAPQVSDRNDLIRWILFGETREYLERVSLSHLVYQELYANPSRLD